MKNYWLHCAIAYHCYNVDHLTKEIFENGFSIFLELNFALIGQGTLFSAMHFIKT